MAIWSMPRPVSASRAINSLPTSTSLRNAAHQMQRFRSMRISWRARRIATRIAYVAVQGQPPNQHYQLLIADADGEKPEGDSRIVAAAHVPGLVGR